MNEKIKCMKRVQSVMHLKYSTSLALRHCVCAFRVTHPFAEKSLN